MNQQQREDNPLFNDTLKFNADLSFQMVLHQLLNINNSQASIGQYHDGRFRILKQVSIMLDTGMNDTEHHQIHTYLNESARHLTEFNSLMQRLGITYDIENGRYSLSNLHGKGRAAIASHAIFSQQSSSLALSLDNWEMSIRSAMKRMGLLFVKDRGLKDAIRDTT